MPEDIHRDIKPNNIFLCSVGLNSDFVKVLDFGLVKNISTEESLMLTQKGAIAGTPAFMAPEVALGDGHIDGRADIYSLGCVAYFLLTGALVFQRKTATAMTMAHVMAAPSPPSHRSELPIPPQLEEILMKCLDKRSVARPQSAEELKGLLESMACVQEWTQANAAAWWQTHLPPSCSYRAERRHSELPIIPSEELVDKSE
ncbi:MAG: serine/threonine protein kinase [Bryobacteraceae bacterium]|nr:serine/threonine protein kinase [Bryobacteraceae bacterium]